MSDSPSHRYYREMADRWRGRLALAITEPRVLSSASMSWMDRLAWRMSAVRWMGPTWLETTVDVTKIADGIVVHTTSARQLGLRGVWGVETITLDPDGRRFSLRGAHRFAWAPWRTCEVRGEGTIDEDARGARYAFDYLGTQMAQTTKIDGRDLIITQTTPFAKSDVRLVRRAR